ncbi:hypothetical protein POM88_040611 [Heracleum sosnowskyi]|uniref:Uncharacterized protein n=1 Tax=Heracleum sosnowskyi TaxID=360622 RepID=A0AAD8HF83_9APIA|nr:hypothetical protein POM88_040611 [Heracleum sosnowskyi]
MVCFGFGFDLIGNDYKVVALLTCFGKPWTAEVYSVNTNVWRRVEPNPKDLPSYDDFDVCVNDFLCCVGTYGMLTFDLNKEASVWALIISHFCHNWGTFILLTWMPTYYNQVLKFNLTESGLVCVLPWLTMAVFANIGGWIADTLISRDNAINMIFGTCFLSHAVKPCQDTCFSGTMHVAQSCDQLATAKETIRRLGMGTNTYTFAALLGQKKDGQFSKFCKSFSIATCILGSSRKFGMIFVVYAMFIICLLHIWSKGK